jgi:LytS/YehU family sensor histidine kinase
LTAVVSVGTFKSVESLILSVILKKALLSLNEILRANLKDKQLLSKRGSLRGAIVIPLYRKGRGRYMDTLKLV